MADVRNTGDREMKWLRRIARIWSSPIIVYSLIMLTGYTWNWVTIGKTDPYTVEGFPFIEALPPIMMFLSVLGLSIAWRWDRLGGTITVVFHLITILLLLMQRPITQDVFRSAIPYIMSIVVVIPGILFWLCWWRSRKVTTIKNSN